MKEPQESTDKKKESGVVRLPFILPSKKLEGFIVEYPSSHKLHIPVGYASEELKRLIEDIAEALK